MNFKKVCSTLVIILVLLAPATAVRADTITQILKLFGVGYAVKAFAPQLNDLINTLTLNRGVAVEDETKVVPILTVGSGAYIGAAQVSGPAEKVSQVQAVAQLEGEFYGDVFRVKALIPVDSINLTQGIHRVDGVGVSALLDLRI